MLKRSLNLAAITPGGLRHTGGSGESRELHFNCSASQRWALPHLNTKPWV